MARRACASSGDRRHAVTECQNRPGPGDDIEPLAKHQDQRENGSWIKNDAGIGPLAMLARSEQVAGEALQNEDVEEECGSGQEGSLRP